MERARELDPLSVVINTNLGVAFMHASHFDEAHDPRLVKLFDIEVSSPYSYWFVCRPRAMQQRPVRLFHDWLVEVLAAE